MASDTESINSTLATTLAAWDDITVIEPRLLSLVPIAEAGGNWPDWSAIKMRFQPLVGWDAIRPELRSSDAYDVAYSHLLRLYEGAA